MGGGGSRLTEEQKVREMIKILLAIWLKEKTHELGKLAGPFVKQSLIEPADLKKLFFETLTDSIKMLHNEFLVSKENNEERQRISLLSDKIG